MGEIEEERVLNLQNKQIVGTRYITNIENGDREIERVDVGCLIFLVCVTYTDRLCTISSSVIYLSARRIGVPSTYIAHFILFCKCSIKSEAGGNDRSKSIVCFFI